MSEAIFTRCVNPPSIMPIAKGGTGETTKTLARRNLDLMTGVSLETNCRSSSDILFFEAVIFKNSFSSFLWFQYQLKRYKSGLVRATN